MTLGGVFQRINTEVEYASFPNVKCIDEIELEGMGDMKLLSQTMGIALNVRMVPPWTRILTSWINTRVQLTWPDKNSAHVNAPISH